MRFLTKERRNGTKEWDSIGTEVMDEEKVGTEAQTKITKVTMNQGAMKVKQNGVEVEEEEFTDYQHE